MKDGEIICRKEGKDKNKMKEKDEKLRMEWEDEGCREKMNNAEKWRMQRKD